VTVPGMDDAWIQAKQRNEAPRFQAMRTTAIYDGKWMVVAFNLRWGRQEKHLTTASFSEKIRITVK